jgi:hypothetical protein
MPSSSSTVERPVDSATSERDRQIAKLTRAMYPVDRQEKFLELQAEVDLLLSQLQSLQQVRQ